jgi:hypothetical protein
MLTLGLVGCLGIPASLASAEIRTERPPGRVAFSAGDIWLIHADGSGKRKRLTSSSDNYAPIVWSADGRWLAFERSYDSSQRDCCVEVRMRNRRAHPGSYAEKEGCSNRR